MEQNSIEWLQWRRQGIGSSDVAAILGISPYSNALKLYQEKISTDPPEQKSNFAMEKGKRLEPKARAMFELHMDASFPSHLLQMELYPFMRTSLDGWNMERNEIAEFKYVGKKVFNSALEEKRIVPHHMCQVQHQLLVSGANRCHYVCCIEEPFTISVVEVFPDISMQEIILNKCLKFWHCVVGRSPGGLK